MFKWMHIREHLADVDPDVDKSRLVFVNVDRIDMVVPEMIKASPTGYYLIYAGARAIRVIAEDFNDHLRVHSSFVSSIKNGDVRGIETKRTPDIE